MDVQRQPPPVDELVKALRPVLKAGLPISPDLSDDRLLGLRGVVARSIEPDERLSRVKALDNLLQRLLAFYPDDELGEAARVLFGMAQGIRGANLTERRSRASTESGYEADHFRKKIEPKIVRQLAWQLHSDSQNYTPRGRVAPPSIDVSGDTPYVSTGDVSNLDRSKHEETLSLLWSEVYRLRAEILRVERLKTWPWDPSEPTTSESVLEEAIRRRNHQLLVVEDSVDSYVVEYGHDIMHGESEFDVRSLTKLAGWRSGK